MIAPRYQELSEKYNDVVFLKLDCNDENRVSNKSILFSFAVYVCGV